MSNREVVRSRSELTTQQRRDMGTKRLVWTLAVVVSLCGLLPAVMAVSSAKVSQASAGGWSAQESGVTTDLNGVHFVDPEHGWVVGADGVILHTEDGGVAWSHQDSGTEAGLNGVYFADLAHGWAVGQDGTLLYTKNGGKDWRSKNSGTNQHLKDIFFRDDNKGWAVGGSVAIDIICDPTCRIVIRAWNNTILRTTNGGDTWSEKANLGRRGLLEAVHFVDDKNGWAAGWNETILHTSDGGKSWDSQSSPRSSEYTGVYFVDTDTGWITGRGDLVSGDSALLHTEDSGDTWQSHSQGSYYDWIDVTFVNKDLGWIVGAGGRIRHTDDGGGYWTTQSSSTTKDLNQVVFAGSENGWAVGNDGVILHYEEEPPTPSPTPTATRTPAVGEAFLPIALRNWGARPKPTASATPSATPETRQPFVTDSTTFEPYAGSTSTYLVGHVNNPMGSGADFVKVTSKFYDNQSRLLAEGMSYTCLTNLAPGMTSPFVDIMPDLPLSAWSTYELQVEWSQYGRTPLSLEISNETTHFDSYDAFHVTGTARNPYNQRVDNNRACVAMLDASGKAIGVWWDTDDEIEDLEPASTDAFDVELYFWKHKPDRSKMASYTLQAYARHGFPSMSLEAQQYEDQEEKSDQLRALMEADVRTAKELSR